MIVYVKKPKEYTRELSELISEFSNIVGYNDNIEKLIVFIYTSKKQQENEIKIWLKLV